MPELGLDIFDKTIHETNTWLGEIAEAMNHPDRQVAYHALRGVLSALRDRLPIEEAHHLAAQLPTLIRGVYFEGYRPANKPIKYKQEEFIEHVSEQLQPAGGANPEAATRAVFEVLSRHVSEGQERQVRDMLPENLRALWPQQTA